MTVSVENFTPAELSQIGRSQPIAFDVLSDKHDGFIRLVVAVSWTIDGQEYAEIAHDGDQFRSRYQGYTNSRTPITDGFRFMLLRDGGWPADPTIEVFPAARDLFNDQVFYEGSSIAGVDVSFSFDLPIPPNAQEGHFAVLAYQSDTSMNIPAGWTQQANYFRSHFGGGTRHQVLTKFFDASDAALTELTITRGSGAGVMCACLGLYSNVDTDNPIKDFKAGTNSADPSIACPGAGCHDAAVSGAGVGTVSFWGTGFLAPYTVTPGDMVVYTMGGGSGGSSGFTNTVIAPTSQEFPTTHPFVLAKGTGFGSVIRVRGVGQGYWLADEELTPPDWLGATLNYNQGLGTSLILQPPQ